MNGSFITGVFPSKLKMSKVTPLHKKGSNLDLNNYHPISLLWVCSKIYEKVTYATIYKFTHNYFIQDNLISDLIILQTMHRSVLRKVSTKTQLIMGNLDVILFKTLKKAFDTVSHSILPDKLSYYGATSIALKWFDSYLSNRKQLVLVNGVSSDLFYWMWHVVFHKVLSLGLHYFLPS